MQVRIEGLCRFGAAVGRAESCHSSRGVDQAAILADYANQAATSLTFVIFHQLIHEGSFALRSSSDDDGANPIEPLPQACVDSCVDAVTHRKISDAARHAEAKRQDKRIPRGEAHADRQRFHSSSLAL